MTTKEKSKGRDQEQEMESRARNRQELGLPETEGSLATLMQHVPGVGLMKDLSDHEDLKKRLSDPELLHNTAGLELGTNFRHGGPNDNFGPGSQAFAEGGQVGDQERGWQALPEEVKSEGDAEIPEDIREYIEETHKATRESRPDEGWRIKAMDKPDAIAPYKRDEEEAAAEEESEPPLHFDEGGQVPDPNAILQEIAPPGTGTISPSPAKAPMVPPGVPPPSPMPAPVAAAPKPPMPSAPGLTDQDFMDKANKMLGLGPDQQAAFMKVLGGNAQKAQIGAGIAGIGDAIASGGTLGKVNPGALNKSEDLIQSRTNEGLQGMQTIRGNQEKAFEMADKLEARDPKSPLSKWAQKAYGGIGKKLGLDLNNASAALIGDVSGKGVEALNVEYQNQLKQMGLSLQQKQVEATIGNQKAERDIAREGHQAEAAKTLADRGIFKTLANAIPGTAGHKATQVLERQALGKEGAGPVAVNSKAEYLALPAGTHYVDSFGTEKVKK